MWKEITFSIFFVLLVQFSHGQEEFNIRYHLSTKTMYWPQQETPYTKPPDSSCKPVQINLMARHGARYPGSGDIDKLTTLSEKMKLFAPYYYPEYEWMASWTNPYVPKQADLLTYSGQVEHYNLAQRFTGNYTEVMTRHYEPYVYDMQCTQKSRTCMSGSSFSFSMFQDDGHLPPKSILGYHPNYMYTQSETEDLTLRFFDNCPAYTTAMDSPEASEQSDLWEPNVVNAGITLSKKIGVYPYWNISSSEISLMYKTCGYQIAIRNLTSEFCSLFDEDITPILEYADDLENYYENGYGFAINYQSACILFKEIFEIHQQYINGTDTDLVAKFRFAHAETLMPLVSLFGLFKDSEPLLANWTKEQIASRKWKSSYISPFAGNLATVLYECSNNNYYLKTLLNEKEQVLPGCSSVYCPFADVLRNYSGPLNYSFDDLCYPGSSPCEYYCPNN